MPALLVAAKCLGRTGTNVWLVALEGFQLMKKLLLSCLIFTLVISVARADDDDVPALMQKLRAKSTSARNQAIAGLAKAGEPAVKPLTKALRDMDDLVAQSASTALGKIGKPAVPALV